MEVDLKAGLNMNSSNLHLITYLSGKDYNLWMLDGFQDFMFEHGFTTGEEITQDYVTKEYELTEQQENLQESWYGIVFALQTVRRNQSGGDTDETINKTETETGTVLCTGGTVLENGGGRTEGDTPDQHGVSSPDELCPSTVQRDSGEVRLPNGTDSEHSPEQLSLF